MKKILSLLLILFVATTLVVACGEKKDEPPKDDPKTEDTTEKPEAKGNAFDGALLSFNLPEGWKANESEGTIMVEKEGDPLSGMTIVQMEGNLAPIDDVIKATMDMMKDSKVEDATIGANAFKRLIIAIAGIETSTLYANASGGLVTITTGKYSDPEVQAILSSILLK
jgi:hypothetical protein